MYLHSEVVRCKDTRWRGGARCSRHMHTEIRRELAADARGRAPSSRRGRQHAGPVRRALGNAFVRLGLLLGSDGSVPPIAQHESASGGPRPGEGLPLLLVGAGRTGRGHPPSPPSSTSPGSARRRTAPASPIGAQSNAITLRIPSWCSISSNPRFTSSSPIRCEMSDARVELACEPAVDELRHLRPPLHAAERRARDPPAGDEESRDDVQRLPLARDAAHRREPPRLARRLDGLPHHLHVARRLERVVGAEAPGLAP